MIRRGLALLLLALLAGPRAGSANGAVDAAGWVRIDAIEVVGALPEGEAGRKLAADIRRRFGVYPGSRQEADSVAFALARLRRMPGLGAVEIEHVWSGADSVTLQLKVAPVDTPAPPRPLVLREDDRGFLKLRAGLKAATAISANQWLGNGATLTEFNPRGRYRGGRGPNGVLDLAPSLGLAAALPLGRGEDAAWIYGSAAWLLAGSVGQDNNRADGRYTGSWEEAYVGVVDGGVTARGSVWRANLSYGRQPYCIGGGMLLCQIAASGGDRAADFGWPRWSGHDFFKAQLRVNDSLIEAFRFTPNDKPSTATTLVGVNLEQSLGPRLQLGFTGIEATAGELRYFRPDGSFFLRDGLRAWQLRGHWRPAPGEAGPLVRGEYALQTHQDEDMRASGRSLEAGWVFGTHRWQPSLSLRHSETTGDDPTTARYERWDLLYSGGDIDSWVQGQLMKNLHYNSNVKVDRLLGRLTPHPQWRLTAAASRYRADTLNNLGGVISTLAAPELGHELLLVGEHTLSRHVYLRFTAAALWPGAGIRGVLPAPVHQPWLVGIAQINIAY